MPGTEKPEDALTKFTKAVEGSTLTEYLIQVLEFGRTGAHQLKARHMPVTKYLIGTTSIIFGLQISLYFLATENSVNALIQILVNPAVFQPLNAFLYQEIPWITWPLSEFIHRGLPHFIPNIVMLAVLGAIVEPRIHRNHFILWFILVAVTVKPFHAYVELLTSTNQYVAIYGISDFAYSLIFFTAPLLYTQENRIELEYLGILIAAAAALQIGIHAATAVLTGSIAPVNPGHFLGAALGLTAYTILTNTDRIKSSENQVPK